LEPADFAHVREEVFAVSTRRDSYHHGERHWRAVAYAGLHLAPLVEDCDASTVLLFALFHDSMRLNEYSDPEHGLRGGELARQLLRDRVPTQQLDVLFEACRDHTHVQHAAASTTAVCWDADRLNLWRVGKEPDPTFLSTAPARDPELIWKARSFHDDEFEWDELAHRASGRLP